MTNFATTKRIAGLIRIQRLKTKINEEEKMKSREMKKEKWKGNTKATITSLNEKNKGKKKTPKEEKIALNT